jgi:hypothetical protein
VKKQQGFSQITIGCNSLDPILMAEAPGLEPLFYEV